MRLYLCLAFGLMAFPSFGWCADEPITSIELGKDDKLGMKAGKVAEPTKIESAEELTTAIADEATRTKLAKKIDFEKQVLIIFTWAGSGQDQLSYEVAESYPEQIFFRYQRGFTKDRRSHQYVFVLRKNVKWSVK